MDPDRQPTPKRHSTRSGSPHPPSSNRRSAPDAARARGIGALDPPLPTPLPAPLVAGSVTTVAPAQRRPVRSIEHSDTSIEHPDTPSTRAPARLLAWPAAADRAMSLAEHEQRHGRLECSQFSGSQGGARLVELAADAGVRGRGGGGFSTAHKIAAVLAATSRRRRPVAVANGCEGDPTSAKDVALLRQAPHLVLDGLALAAHALGATEAVLCVHRGSPVIPTLRQAITERTRDPVRVDLATVPRRYVSSEASALARFLTDGDARPTSSPPQTATAGVHGRPTLVDNVETLAHLALIARHGPGWFRARGTHRSPGTTLVTVGGAVNYPGVFEIDLGTRLGDILHRAGGASQPTEAMLLGGLGGRWLASTPNLNTQLCYEGHHGVRLGIPSLVVLPADVCGLAVTSTILTCLAGESAGQCGPCRFGLPAIAADVASLAAGHIDAGLRERLRRRLELIPGRGACSHPDGAAQLATSALVTFSADLARHLTAGGCGRFTGSTLELIRTLPVAAGGWV